MKLPVSELQYCKFTNELEGKGSIKKVANFQLKF